MDGVEATRRIRKLDGPAARTPIVAMTANVMKHQIIEYLAAGMDGAVAKPLNPSMILAELARLANAEAQPLAALG
jgi:CheY-like chemotaxis protein